MDVALPSTEAEVLGYLDGHQKGQRYRSTVDTSNQAVFLISMVQLAGKKGPVRVERADVQRSTAHEKSPLPRRRGLGAQRRESDPRARYGTQAVTATLSKNQPSSVVEQSVMVVNAMRTF